MTQKIIQIGSSAGITIPKRQLEDLGLKVGDEVDFEIRPTRAQLKDFSEELDKFMEIYEQDLKNLARR